MDLKFFSVVVFLIFHYVATVTSLNDEGLALLSFKRAIGNSTAGYLDNWNSSDLKPCSWHGVQCNDEKVVFLSIPNKGLTGFLHLDGSRLDALRHVNLKNNNFSGSLPPELFNASGLKTLFLSGNSFSGPVPRAIGNLKNLQSLDLSQNSFSGSIPSSLLRCKKLKKLFLGRNSFSGSLPDGFGTNLAMLQNLSLTFNNFSGLIPNDLGNLSSLQGTLDLSHNLFSGRIPENLGNVPEFVYINLSYNNLSGPIPRFGDLVNVGPPAFVGNPQLCGPPLKTICSSGVSDPKATPKPLPLDPSRNSRHGLNHWLVVAIVSGPMLGICLIALMVSYWYRRVYACRRSKHVEGNNLEEKSVMGKDMFCFRTDDLESLSENMEQCTFMPLDAQVNFDLEQLLKASAFLLGKSRIGILYKVVIQNGPTVVVRRLEDGGSQRFREFQNDVEAIGKIRHPNIITLLAYCWSTGEKLLVYDYAPNGDLATAIHGKSGTTYSKPLPWAVRLRILKGIAKGLAFLHDCSPKKYVHGSLKLSNILLGENMEPRISDFGLSRLSHATEEPIPVHWEISTNGTPTIGTPQQRSPYALTPPNARTSISYYEAPEASKAAKPSQKWDVYSFGVITLEIVSGKSPILLMGSSEMNLVQWIQLSIEVKSLSEVLDPFLVHDLDKKDEMVAALKMGLACVHGSPDKRPSMRNVNDTLEKLAASASTPSPKKRTNV